MKKIELMLLFSVLFLLIFSALPLNASAYSAAVQVGTGTTENYGLGPYGATDRTSQYVQGGVDFFLYEEQHIDLFIGANYTSLPVYVYT
jgi:hypothetical protein